MLHLFKNSNSIRNEALQALLACPQHGPGSPHSGGTGGTPVPWPCSATVFVGEEFCRGEKIAPSIKDGGFGCVSELFPPRLLSDPSQSRRGQPAITSIKMYCQPPRRPLRR